MVDVVRVHEGQRRVCEVTRNAVQDSSGS